MGRLFTSSPLKIIDYSLTIRYLKYREIDKVKWDAAISMDERGLPYAFSWYLDVATAKKWDALIGGDYQYVCPLIWNKKMAGISQIYVPRLVQQLGVFGKNVDDHLTVQFLKKIPSKFRQVVLPLNLKVSSTTSLKGILASKTNLVLDLQSDYDTLFSNYHKSLRKRLKKAKAAQKISVTDDVTATVDFYKKNMKTVIQVPRRDWPLILDILKAILKNTNSIILKSETLDNELTGLSFFIVTKNRIINLFGSTNQLGKSIFSMHLLIDSMINKYAGQEMIFDFEGSGIKGIYDFFKSFGSGHEDFSMYRYQNLPYLLKKIQDWRKN